MEPLLGVAPAARTLSPLELPCLEERHQATELVARLEHVNELLLPLRQAPQLSTP